MPPGEYPHALDCAWDDYFAATEEYSVTQSKFQTNPDDLAALTAAVTAQKAGLEAAIIACLKSSNPNDTCCTQPDMKKPG